MRSSTFATGCGFRSMAMPGTDTSCLSPATPLSHPPHSHCAADVRGRAQEARRGRRTCNSKGSADALTSGLRRPPRAACSPSSPGCLSRLRAKFLVPLALLSGLGLAAPALAAADTTSPTIASVTLSSTPTFDADGDNTADTYIRGDRIVVDVRFSEAVTVSGGNNSVRLRLDLGADDTNLANSRKVLKLKSVVGGDTLRFEHKVGRRNSDPDGVWVQTASATNARMVFTVGGAAVTSTATGAAAVLTKTGLPTTGAANHKVDGSRTQAATAGNRAPTFPATAPASLEVAENNAAGAPVGRVSATDPDGDALTYALDSASDAAFDIDSSGAITVTGANALDYETKASYAVTVSVHDGKNAAGSADTKVDATHSVTITVTDVEESTAAANSAPGFPANAPTTLEVAENNAAGAAVGTVAATDSDGDSLTYALDSASDAVFDIDSSGNITVTAANALDHETKASYAVTVSVHDGKNAAGYADTTVDATHSLTIAVTDVQETTSGPPTISSVTISSTPSFDADGDNTADTYVRGDRIVVDVRFSEAVTISGGNNGVRLRLDLGTDDTNLANSRRVLKLKSVVGGDTLRFEHTVARRDSDTDGVWVQTLTATNARTVLTVGATVASTATGTAAVLTKSGLPTTGAANHKVDGSRTQAPAVTNRAPTFPATAPASLEVAENNAASAAVGTVAATDPDGDALTYALDSASDAVFDIDSSGAITVTAANALDHETKASYAVTVSVHDGKDAAGQPDTGVDATHSMTITVTDVEESTVANRAPTFPANAPTTLEVAENNAAGAPVGQVSATDPDGDALTYTLDSASEGVFDIDSSGSITVKAANALNRETKASYAVTVSVHDGKDAAAPAGAGRRCRQDRASRSPRIPIRTTSGNGRSPEGHSPPTGNRLSG